MTREQERLRAAEAKLRREQHQQELARRVEALNQDLAARVEALENLLASRLEATDFLGPEELVQPSLSPPDFASFQPPRMAWLAKIWGPTRTKYGTVLEESKAAYRDAQRKYEQRQAWLERRHAQVLARDGQRDRVHAYFIMVLKASRYPSGFPQLFRLSFIPGSKQLVVEYELPPFTVIPTAAGYRHVKNADKPAETPRTASSQQALYRRVISQMAVRTIYELFAADQSSLLDVISFMGVVDTIDRATGKPDRPCLVTVRTIRETFLDRDFSRVDAIACLKSLSADVSKSPAEYLPVRPVVNFNKVDPRFIEEVNILAELDQRPNLMQLGWGEFEHLIQNLFQKMGFEAKATRPSRDGGIDCVAFDERPILGGKVVIQAKRYTHNVPVSAVRDLFGSMDHERASKGILVTTSDYTPAAYEFANGKPMELITGGELLWLLENHTGFKAKIEPSN